jgi:Transcriptional regulators
MSTERAKTLRAEKSAVDLFRDLLHGLLLSSVDSWIDLQLTVPQLRALFAVAHEPDCPVGRVAQALGIGKATAGHLVERLVRVGLVERYEAPGDRRSLRLRLTAEGKDQIDRLLGWERLVNAGLGELSASDEKALKRALTALIGRIDKASK